jgi:hypothetical protein
VDPVSQHDLLNAIEVRLSTEWKVFSGQFTSRKTPGDEKLVEHSGLIIADLDSLGADLFTVRVSLRLSPHLSAMFLSPSGDGLNVCFAVFGDASRHGDSFRAVAAQSGGEFASRAVCLEGIFAAVFNRPEIYLAAPPVDNCLSCDPRSIGRP